MNNPQINNLFIYFVLLILLITFVILIHYNCFNIKSTFENLTEDYLSFKESDFENLSKSTQWKIRFKCMNNFNELKFHYSKINYKNLNKFNLLNNLINGKIFVNIASYRDKECSHTINNLINNAKNKHNLRIVVCQQNDTNDSDALNGNEKYSNLIEVIRLKYTDAKGPTYARFLIQQQYNNEEYYLQIDSHTVFEKDWDIKLIETLNNLPPKSCITQYLPEYNMDNKKAKSYKIRTGLKVDKINNVDGFTRITSDFEIQNNSHDLNVNEANAWSACFSFSKGNICIDAPIDPYTPELFFGEEMDIALRLFTRGWTFWSPNYPIAYTNFNRNYRKTFWNKKTYNKKLTLISRIRVHYRLNTLPEKYKKIIEEKYPELLIDIDNFKLGNMKTLEDYEDLTGVDIVPI